LQQQPVVQQAAEQFIVQPEQKPKVVLQPEVLLQPEAILPAKGFHETKTPVILPIILDAIPAEARPVELPDPLLEPVFDIPPQPETFADRLADLADLLHGERIPDSAPRIFRESAAPGPRVETPAKKTPVVIDVTFSGDVTFHEDVTPARTLLAAPPIPLLLAAPQAPLVAQGIPMEAFDPCAAASARPHEPSGASVRADLVTEPAAASPVVLPEPPNRVVAPALAPLHDYSEAADRLMRPVESGPKTVPFTALPTVTLAGPLLPRELMSLQAAGLVPIRRGSRRGEAPLSRNRWVMKYVVVGMLLTAGLATYSLMPGSSMTSPARPTPEPAPEPPVSAQLRRPANSLARLVEVTGVRFMEVNKKPQIHYLVVNHSGAPLASMTVYVTLRATTARQGEPPIAKLTFRSPALAAFEAKEMFSSIERTTAPVDLPDWQDLRADVEVQ